VSWGFGAREDAAKVSIAWRELGGPAVASAPKCKYGVSIIRYVIPQELGGSVELAFPSGGVCANIEIPLGPAHNGKPARADGVIE
jgi:two-component sensor histidine kinase